MITTEREQAARSVQHFKEVPKRLQSNKPADPDNPNDLNIYTNSSGRGMRICPVEL